MSGERNHLKYLSLDSMGRVVLPNHLIESVEGHEGFISAGANWKCDGTSNSACTNNTCNGTFNGACSNRMQCGGTTTNVLCDSGTVELPKNSSCV